MIVTEVPVPPELGVKPAIARKGMAELVLMKVKVPLLVAVPPGVVTETGPVAPLPTTAVIEVSELTKYEAAAVPPKLTALTADDDPPP